MSAVNTRLGTALNYLRTTGELDAESGETRLTADLWKVAAEVAPNLFPKAPTDTELIAQLRTAYRAGRGEPGPLALRIPEAYEYVDRTLATASWWDRYTIHPGLYLISFYTSSWAKLPGNTLADAADHCDELRRHPDPAKRNWLWPNYGMATLTATLEESYRVNRLFTASSSETTYPGGESQVRWTPYAYNVQIGMRAYGGEVVELRPCEDCDAKADEECEPDCQGIWDGLVAANAGSAQ